MINNTRKVFDTLKQETHSKDQFITKVEIELMLSISKLTKFDHKTQKRVCVNLHSVKRPGSRSQALQITNDLIQQSDLAIILSSPSDDPFLKDSDKFEKKLITYHFNKVWVDVIISQN